MLMLENVPLQHRATICSPQCLVFYLVLSDVFMLLQSFNINCYNNNINVSVCLRFQAFFIISQCTDVCE